MPARIPTPWLAFLRDVDHGLRRSVEVHCLGGFVLTVCCGLPRSTGDVDFVDVVPPVASEDLMRVGGSDSEIARRHGIHFHRVTIAEIPEGYASRLIPLTPRGFERLRLRALEAHDVVLAKLGRNRARDRGDVEFLARKRLLDPRVLAQKFEAELRPYLLNPEREATTVRLWLDEFFGMNHEPTE